MLQAAFNATGTWFCPLCGHCNRLNKRWNHWRLRCSSPKCRTVFSVGLALWRNAVGSRKPDSMPPDILFSSRRRKRGGPVNVLASEEPSLESTLRDVGQIMGEGEVGEG